MQREIVIQNKTIRRLKGWSINTTDGYSVRDVLNTSNRTRAQKHVQHLLAQGHTINQFSVKRWEELKG